MSDHRPQRLDAMTPRETKDGKTFWTKCGVAFPSKNGPGWNVQLDALPVNGKLILMEPKPRDGQPQTLTMLAAPPPAVDDFDPDRF